MKRTAYKILTALVAGVLSLEVALQLAGVITPATQLRVSPRQPAGAIRILCVGDSHTYGAALPRDQSYPAQLEVRLNELGSAKRFEVLNLGIPGINSAMLANGLESRLIEWHPQILIVWVGLNNFWNVAETETRTRGKFASTAHRILLHSKVYRLLTVLWHTSERESPSSGSSLDSRDAITPIEATMLQGDGVSPSLRPDDSEWYGGLVDDYQRIVSIADAYDTPLVFVTYPKNRSTVFTSIFETTNRAIMAVVEQHGLPVVFTSDDTLRATRDGYEDKDLIMNAAGPHPTRILYGYIVESIVSEISTILALRGVDGADE